MTTYAEATMVNKINEATVQTPLLWHYSFNV